MPGDKSISHRALLLAALAEGESRIGAASDGADVRSTAGIVASLGAIVERVGDDGRTVDYVVASDGVDALREPDRVLDCGNSGTSLRLSAGVLAGPARLRRPRRGRFIAGPSGRSYHRATARDGRRAPRPTR